MKPALRYPVVIAVLVAIAVIAWKMTRSEPVKVAIYRVDRDAVEATVANTRAGTVEACRRARIAPAAGGQVAKLLVKKGDRVETGQLLLELWNADLAAQLTVSERDAAAARARVEETCVQAENARRESDRLATLLRKGLVSKDTAEQSATQASARAASCRAARDGAEVAVSRIALANANLERTRLRAPFAGIVAEISGELGEYITPSPPGIPTPPAIDLVDDSCLYVSAPIDEVDAPSVRLGMPARITLDAFPGKRYAGKVRHIAPYVLDLEKQARTVEVEIEFTDRQDRSTLLAGYSADAEIILDTRTDVLRIPSEAILEGGRVLVLGDDGLIGERDITTGVTNWQVSEITAGLEAGERVITSVEREGVVAGAQAVAEDAGGSAQ